MAGYKDALTNLDDLIINLKLLPDDSELHRAFVDYGKLLDDLQTSINGLTPGAAQTQAQTLLNNALAALNAATTTNFASASKCATCSRPSSRPSTTAKFAKS